jgi:hypothetical protein
MVSNTINIALGNTVLSPPPSALPPFLSEVFVPSDYVRMRLELGAYVQVFEENEHSDTPITAPLVALPSCP